MKREEIEFLQENGYEFASDWDVVIDENGKHYVVYWNLPHGKKLIKNLVRCIIFDWTPIRGRVRKWDWTIVDGQPALLVPKSFVYFNKLLLGKRRELHRLFLTRILGRSRL